MLDVVKRLKRIRRMENHRHVPLQGPAIRGTDHVKDVLDRLFVSRRPFRTTDARRPHRKTSLNRCLVDAKNAMATGRARVGLSRIGQVVGFTKPSSALDDVGFRGVLDLRETCRPCRPARGYINASEYERFSSLKVKADTVINGKQVLATVLSTIAQRPYGAVLGPNARK